MRLLSPRTPLPELEQVRLLDHFTADEMRRGARFARPQIALGLARGALDLAALATLVARRRSRPVAGASTVARATLAGALTGSGLAVTLSLPGLPLAALARRRALAVGLVTQSWRGWGADLAKATAIQGVLAGAGGAAVVYAMRRWPRGWWLAAAGGSVAFGAALATLAPVVLDPVFSDFTPLPEGQTRDDVLALAAAAGVRVGEVYAVDASRRTTAANAYVTGLGPTKRVVLFDTLLDRYDRDQVRVVVAHELAHVRHRDVLRSVAFAALSAPAAALAVQQLGWTLTEERGSAGALPAVALSLAIVSLPVGLLGARLSRRVELRADALSLELTGAAQAFAQFERAVAVQNVADVDPPRLARMVASHPPTGERIGMALAFERRARPAPAR